jgi:hypothetical protein
MTPQEWIECLFNINEMRSEIEFLGDKHGKGNLGAICGGWCDYSKEIFGELPDMMDVGFIAGFFYKTGQFLSESIDKRSISAMQKSIDATWDITYFPKNIDHREVGRCSWCDYKPDCIDNLDLLDVWGAAEGYRIPSKTITESIVEAEDDE